ncbi:MAG: hypothetical protein ACXVH0_04950 [Thermoanaerobaculia bacterium]
MSRSRRSRLSPLLVFFLAAVPARAAIDSIVIDARNPASPATLRGRTPSAPWNASNSVEVVFHYNLDSETTGYVAIFTGVPPNPSHTGLETVFEISDDGPGKGAKRFSVLCDGKSAAIAIKRIKVALMTKGPVGPVTLATKFLDVDYTFRCRVTNPTPSAPVK